MMFKKLKKLSLLMIALPLIILSGCSQRVIYEINNGCHLFEKGTGSVKDTRMTLLWLENHNDVYTRFCEVGNENL